LSVSDGTPTLLLPARVGATGSGAAATDAVFALALALVLAAVVVAGRRRD
jgi:hypothetical protein